MEKLYVVRVEFSQTDHRYYGIRAYSQKEAQEKADIAWPRAFYRNVQCALERILE